MGLQQNIRQALVDNTPEAIQLLAPSFGVVPGQVKEEDEILNPLDMEMDDEDLLVGIFPAQDACH